MEFLPIVKEGIKVYAGFWKRLGAGIIDTLVCMPIAVIMYRIWRINIAGAIIASVIIAFYYSIYNVWLSFKYGGTLGKLIVGIRITKVGGEPIDLREALLRSSVDITFGLFFATLEVYAISQVNADAYLNAEYMEKSKLIMQFYPVLYKSVDILRAVWYCSEMIVLLFNKRKRALHDFIAGTVVIHKEFAYRQDKLSRTDKVESEKLLI